MLMFLFDYAGILSSFLTILYFFDNHMYVNSERNGKAILLVIFMFLISISFSHHFRQAKMHTLQVLASENRGLTLHLLLLFEHLKLEGRFSYKLRVSNAIYEYRFKKSDNSSDTFDMNCKFQFEMPSIFGRFFPPLLFSRNLDFLILQPNGVSIDASECKINNGDFIPINVDKVASVSDKENSPKFLQAQIQIERGTCLEKLIISYNMAGVDKIDKNHLGIPIIVCPFFYIKKARNIEFRVIYPIDGSHRPKTASLKTYPYGWTRNVSKDTRNVIPDGRHLTWTGRPKSPTTQAIYVIEMYTPVEIWS